MQPNDPQSLSQLMDGEWQGLDPSDCAASACRDPALQAKWARWHLIRDALHNEPLRVDSGLAARVHEALRDEPAYSNVASIGVERSGAAWSALEPPSAEPTDAHEHGLPVRTGTDSLDGAAASVVPTTPATRGMSLRGGLGGFALVASVALVTAVGINLWRDAPGLADEAVDTTVATEPGPIGELASAGPVDTARRRVLPVQPAETPIPDIGGTHWITSSADRVADAENRLNLLLSQHIEYSPSAETTGILPYSRLIGYDALEQ